MAATPSSTELPEYVPGEFDQLLKPRAEGGEAPVEEAPEATPDRPVEAAVSQGAMAEGEEDELVLLELHMNALLEAGGRRRLRDKVKDRLSSTLLGR